MFSAALLVSAVAVGQTPVDEAAPEVAPEADQLVPPTLIESVDPEYPAAAFDADVEADVILTIDIDGSGDVVEIVPTGLVYYSYADDGSAIEDPRGLDDDPYGFVERAVDAMAGYVFEPATAVSDPEVGPVPIPVRVTWRVGFVIDYETVVVAADDVLAEGSGEGAELGTIEVDGPVNFRGALLERGTRAPLVGFVVRVRLGALEASATSDESGGFEFRGLPSGGWAVEIDEVGYFTYEVDEEIERGQVIEATYYVERNPLGDYVSRTVAEAPRREVTRRVLEITEVQRIPGNANDAIRVVQNLPGVARPMFGGGDVIVRGSAPEDTGFYVDGMRVPLIYHFGGLRSVVPTELLSDVAFYPGGFGVDYGRQTGGIVNASTRDDAPERIGGHVDVNAYDSGFFLRAPLSERVSLELGGRRSYIDAILRPLGPAIGLEFATAPRWYDYQARLSVDIGERHVLRVLALGSDDLIDFVLEDEDMLDPETRGGIRAEASFHGGIVSLHSELSDTVENELKLAVLHQRLGFSFGDALFFNLTNQDLHFRDTLTWTPSDRVALRYGLDIEAFPGRIDIRLPRPPKEGEEPVDFDPDDAITEEAEFRFYWPAHFAGAEIQATDWLQLLPGIRSEYYRPTETWGFDARFALRAAVSDDLTLKGSVSNHHQAPTADETADSFGNPDLHLESAVHYVAGLEWALTDFLSANVDLFFKDLGQLVSRSDRVVERDGETVAEIYNNGGEGRIYGLELLLRHELSNRFFGWIAYTLSRSERLDFGESSWRLFDFDQTHILTVLGSYDLRRNWSIGGRFRLVSGNPSTPIVGAVYDSDADMYVRIPGAANSDRLPTFHQFDLRIDKRWIRDRWTMNVYLDLQNVYNRKNAEVLQYDYDYTESARVSGLPIIPGLGLRAEW